jgi:Tol biopolymer transport system component
MTTFIRRTALALSVALIPLVGGCGGGSTTGGSEGARGGTNLVKGSVELVSATVGGTPANASSRLLAWSPDGTEIAFLSSATNLHSPPNHHSQVFVKNLRTGSATLVSSSSAGKAGNGDASGASWSSDGTRLLFQSAASNLVPGGRAANINGDDVFMKDLRTGATTLVAPDSGPDFALSPDGTRIAFATSDGNIVPGNEAMTMQLYVRNIRTGVIRRVSENKQGAEANGQGVSGYSDGFFVWSPDSTRIAFIAESPNLVVAAGSQPSTLPNQAFPTAELFVANLRTGAITLASSTKFNQAADGSSCDYDPPAWSPDGTRIAFESEPESNLAPSRTPSGESPGQPVVMKNLSTGSVTLVSPNENRSYYGPSWSPDGTRIAFFTAPIESGESGPFDIFVRNLQSGTVTRVSVTKNGRAGNGESGWGSWSPDGSRMLFSSKASNLVPGDTNRNIDIFMKDFRTSAITLVSSSASGRIGNGASETGIWSPDGRSVAFTSAASNLVARNTRGAAQVFVKVVAK